MTLLPNSFSIRKNKFISFRWLFTILPGIVLFTFLANGCGENVDKIQESQVFRYNEDVSVNTLDPVYIKSQSEIWIGSQIYEGLVTLNDQLKPVPQIAKSWEISDSGCVYKFVINRKIQFVQTPVDGNGHLEPKYSSLGVKDIAFSLYRLLDPKTASPGAWILNDKMDFPQEMSPQNSVSQKDDTQLLHPSTFQNPNQIKPKDQKTAYNSSNTKHTTQVNNSGSNNPKSMAIEPAYERWRKIAQSPIYTPNDSTIILRLNKPFPAFLSLLATNYAWITPYNAPNLGTHPVGSGPFFLRRWETDVKMVLLKNPRYPLFDNGIQLPYLEAVNISFVKSKQTAFMQFMAGSYDFFNGVEASFIDELLTDSAALNPKYKNRIDARITEFLNTEYIGFYLGDSLNGKRNPYTDLALRKALQLGVDRVALLRYLRNGLGIPGGSGFVPPALSHLTSSEIATTEISQKAAYNPEIAKSYYVKSAYFQNPNQFDPLVLSTTADYLDMAVYLQNAWKQIGIPVKIEIQTGGMLRQLRNAGKLGMFRGSWIADYPDAENYLACFYSPYKAPNGPNYTHYQSAEFDVLFEQVAFLPAQESQALAKRDEAVYKANKRTFEDAPVVVLYYDKSVRLFQKNVKGLGNDPINRLDLRRVRKN